MYAAAILLPVIMVDAYNALTIHTVMVELLAIQEHINASALQTLHGVEQQTDANALQDTKTTTTTYTQKTAAMDAKHMTIHAQTQTETIFTLKEQQQDMLME